MARLARADKSVSVRPPNSAVARSASNLSINRIFDARSEYRMPLSVDRLQHWHMLYLISGFDRMRVRRTQMEESIYRRRQQWQSPDSDEYGVRNQSQPQQRV